MFSIDREVLAAIRKERVILVCLGLMAACGIGLATIGLHFAG